MLHLYIQNEETVFCTKVEHLVLKWQIDWNQQWSLKNVSLSWEAVSLPLFTSMCVFATNKHFLTIFTDPRNLWAFHLMIGLYTSLKLEASHNFARNWRSIFLQKSYTHMNNENLNLFAIVYCSFHVNFGRVTVRKINNYNIVNSSLRYATLYSSCKKAVSYEYCSTEYWSTWLLKMFAYNKIQLVFRLLV